MIIGITGSIGSGKTTIAKLFSKHHFSRIDADEIAHKMIGKNAKAYKLIIKTFGNGILDKNKNIDRKKLGDIVFYDSKKLKELNSMMHPLIINEIKNRIEKIKKKCGSDADIIIDAPLLLETDAKKLVDKVIVVKASSGNIIKRNRKFPVGQLEKFQMPLNEKLKHADFVIGNNGDLKNLEKQVEKAIKTISLKTI